MKLFKLDKIQLSQWLNIGSGLILMLMGIFFFVNHRLFIVPLSVIFIILGVYKLILVLLFIDRTKTIPHLVQGLSFLFFGFVLAYRDNTIFSMLGLFLIFWSLINTVVKFLNLYFFYSLNKKIKLGDILIFVLNLGITITLFLLNEYWNDIFVISFSVYCLYYGFEMIVLGFKEKLIRQPNLIQLILPSRLVSSLQKGKLKGNFVKNEILSGDFVNIYIYLGDRFQDKVGHVDIGYQGKIYTYGAHDPHLRNKFFLWGNGVLIIADENRFIEVALHDENKTIIKFVYRLTLDEKMMLENQISNLMDQTIEFDWPKLSQESQHYAVMINQKVGSEHSKFYLFKDDSIFKTYNLFKVNCVLVTYYLLNTSNRKLFNIEGLITPGAYYEVLFYLMHQKNSPIQEMVIVQSDDFTL